MIQAEKTIKTEKTKTAELTHNTQHTKKTYFISDLHLDPSKPHLNTLFHAFIKKIRADAEVLYILGDLFEFWIGDDILDLPFGEPYLPIIDDLKSLSDSGVTLYFIRGNRDFLIGDTFMKRIGATLLPDQYVIDLYGTPALIMHGDTLCTDDKAYQRLRKILRLWIVQKIYLSMSPNRRSQKASQIRQKTSESIKQKSAVIMDVNQHAVKTALKQSAIDIEFKVASYEANNKANNEANTHHAGKTPKSGGVSFLIHGHTHRPAEHALTINNQSCKRIVLGDWGDNWSYLQWDETSNYVLDF